ncbi:transcriptional regulator [Opitutaceae bacterium TAV1]|nr:transcriptional regulator [Opitutaceae bacterium TAV1]
MNVHHLELFYHVALHGGISRAVRRMPWGIQQPAVSSQLLQLEQDLGTRLFDRIPFRLTPAGEELFAFVQPFFGNLDAVAARLRTDNVPQLRIAAAELALRDHLPAVIAPLRKRTPGLRLTLRSGFQPEMEAWLQAREIDLAFVPLENKPPARFRCEKLLRLPIVLLVPRDFSQNQKTAAPGWWPGEAIAEPLISLPAAEIVSRIFAKNLKRLGVDWPVSIEAGSLDLVTRYVVAGHGIGVSVGTPENLKNRAIRAIPVPKIEPLEIAALWRGEPEPIVNDLLAEVRRYVREDWPA